MFIQETDLFKDVSKETMEQISKIMVGQSHEKGAVLYTQSDPARDFYVLVEGRVRLAIGKEAEITYMVARPGEVFGWSSMVDRETYTANAECAAPSRVLKVSKDALEGVFEKDPRSGMLFFKRLAGAVVQRLVANYESFLAEGSLKEVSSYGTRQVMPSGEE